jgi:hypothetical protein
MAPETLDNQDTSHGLQICDAANGVYCCQRDYDCCTNSTALLHLGVGTPLQTLARPTSPPDDEQPPKSKYTKETVIGIGVGFSIAAMIFLVGGCVVVYRKRWHAKRDARKAEKGMMDEPKELDAVDTMPGYLRYKQSQQTLGDSSNPIELDTVLMRAELDTYPLPTRSGSGSSPISPATPGSETETATIGTLVTPIRMELEAPFKIDNPPPPPPLPR